MYCVLKVSKCFSQHFFGLFLHFQANCLIVKIEWIVSRTARLKQERSKSPRKAQRLSKAKQMSPAYPLVSLISKCLMPVESLMRGGDMMHVDNDGEMTEEQQNLMQELENKRRARGIPVPTDDAKVRQFLRMLSEPITLFGEGPFERRERLRLIMARRDDRELTNLLEPKETAMDESDDENEEFFTEGGEALENARRFFVDCSLRNARKRSDICSQIFSTVSANDWRNHLKNTYKSVSTFELAASQIAATRPLSTCAFSPDGSQLITGCFDGKLKMFKIPDCSEAETKYQGNFDAIELM
jgi:U4/U6 small nuclear ribonucleoprotein PRP4